MRRKSVVVLTLVALLGLLDAHAGLASNGGIAPPAPRSSNASGIVEIYWILVAVTGAIFVLVEGALIVFLIRFRSRGRSRELEGPQIRGHTRLELIWTAVPVLILAGIVSFVFYKLPGIKNVPRASAAAPNLKVRIDAHQFYWDFTYPNGVVVVNRMRAPATQVVELDIHSTDVDHSWWIPALGGKFDAIPGKVNHTWFRATRPGIYKGQCGEFCGLEHAAMQAAVEAVPATEFASWLSAEASAQSSGSSQLGQATFKGVCATCHGFRGEGAYGPKLAGNPLMGQRSSLLTLLSNGRGKMPAVGRGWSKRQTDALIAYAQQHFAPKGSNGG